MVWQQYALKPRQASQRSRRRIESGKAPFLHLTPHTGLSREAQARHLATLNRLNRLHRDRHPGQPELNSRIEAFEMAFKMQQSAPDLMDLSNESAETLEMYGVEPDKPSFFYFLRCRRWQRLLVWQS